MIKVLAGTNWFGVKTRLEELRAEFVKKNGELAVEMLDAETNAFEQIQAAVESLPFLAEQKMVIIHRPSQNKTAVEKLGQLIQKTHDAVEVIIVESQLDKRSVYYKTLKKLDGFEELNEPDEIGIIDWAIKFAADKDAHLSRSDAQYLVDRVGVSQQRLSNEIEKLAAYSNTVSKETIDLLVEATPQGSIFNLIDTIFRGDTELALHLYDNQRAQGIEPLNILGMLVWQLHAVVLVRAGQGKSASEISAVSGLKPFVVQKSQQIGKRFSDTQMKKLLDDLLDLDIKFKTTSIDQDVALKNILVSLV